jgi:hypothetical protein
MRRSAFAVLMRDHPPLARRGPNFCSQQSASCGRFWLSIQP